MYIVEGNIGAGKSTFLKLISYYTSLITVALEPINTWQSNVYGQSILANFYQKPQRWAYTMETFALMCRVREHLKEQQHPNPLRIIERSIYSGHYVFSYNSYQTGLMNDIEWKLYNTWFNHLIPNACLPPRGFIYLRTDPSIAYERIKKRNRIAEKNITFAYLKQIHQQHEKFLIERSGLLDGLKQVPILLLDCNKDFEENDTVRHEHFEKVQEFMLTHQ